MPRRGLYPGHGVSACGRWTAATVEAKAFLERHDTHTLATPAAPNALAVGSGS